MLVAEVGVIVAVKPVSAKVAELDGIDESFFEFTDIDLRNLDQKISNIKNGVVEFEDCNNVKLPLNSQAVMDDLLKFNNITSVKDQQALAESLTENLINDEKWKLLFPNDISIDLKINTDFLAELPKSIMMALLSPKVLLPLMIMLKSLQQNAVDLIENLTDMSRYLKKYTINIMSKIGGLFVEELFELIRKDIRRLISEIASDVLKESANKKLSIILRLIELILIIVITLIVSFKGFNDLYFFRKYDFNIGSIRSGEQIRMFTSGFLHVDLMHLIFNYWYCICFLA